MSETLIKRKNILINIAFFAALAGAAYLFYKYALSVTAPFLAAFFISVFLQKPLRKLDKKIGKRFHALWSILLVLMLIIFIIIPIILILSVICDAVAELITYVSSEYNDLSELLNTLKDNFLSAVSFLPSGIHTSVSDFLTNLIIKITAEASASSLDVSLENIASNLSSGLTGIYNAVKNVPSVLLGTIIGIIACILFTKDYEQIVDFIIYQLPDDKKSIPVELKSIFSTTIFKMIKAYSKIMLITFCELTLGFTILNLIGVTDNDYIVIIALLIAAFDILPVAGSGGILIPWAVISAFSSKIPQAIGLIVIYVIITVIRQYIEPKIVGKTLEVHPILTLAGLYIGLKLFGVIGMFAVPIAIVVIKAFNESGRIRLYKSVRKNTQPVSD